MDMSLQNLRSFIETYRCLSISEAARNLNLTQPAVSQHITSLEAQLNRQLFLRQSRGVKPTGFAEELAAEIGDGLDRAEAALSSMKARSSELSGTVHIAGPAELMADKIASHLRPLQKSGLKVRLHLGGKVSLYEMLLEGQVDLAFTASKPNDERLAYQNVGSERLLLVASPKMASQLTESHDLRTKLLSLPLVSYDIDRPLIRDWCRVNAIDLEEISPAMTAPDIRLLRAMVEADIGWTVMPDYLCERAIKSGTLKIIDAPISDPTNDFFLTWVKASLRHSRVAFTRNTLLEALNGAS